MPVKKCIVIALLCLIGVNCDNRLKVIKRIYDNCQNKTEIMKCFKIMALKFADRISKDKKLEVFYGLEIVQDINLNRTARFAKNNLPDDEVMERMDGDEINDLLYELAINFLETHSVNLNLPKLVEESRRRRRKNRYGGAIMAAMAVKGVLMSMAYKAIAVMAGTALIIGKMALVLAAVLGLKKLVSNDKEKTTFEIVKHPSHSSSHTFSSSLEEGEGHYRRSMGSAEDMLMLEKIFKKFS